MPKQGRDAALFHYMPRIGLPPPSGPREFHPGRPVQSTPAQFGLFGFLLPFIGGALRCYVKHTYTYVLDNK